MSNDNIFNINRRILTANEIMQIKEIVKLYPGLSRSELVKTVCVNLRWMSAVGSRKEKKIEEILVKLEEQGEVKLPERRAVIRDPETYRTAPSLHKKRRIIPISEKTDAKEEICGIVNEFMPITVQFADTIEKEDLWDEYVERYHGLKYGSPFGDRIKYFITIGGKVPQYAGCMMFSASAWSLEKRDRWIGWTKEDRFSRLYLIINNTRFLIFPWIKIKNLASYSLAQASKRIQDDWWLKHRYKPVLLETFVDSEKYSGVSYRAANWIYLGNTKGYGRNNVTGKRTRSLKQIYMYPLVKDFRDSLTGKKEVAGEIYE